MSDRARSYLFYDVAVSVCPRCWRKVDGKILIEGERVLLERRCPEHGLSRSLLADDVDYYRRSREVFLKVPEQPNRYNTPVKWGCPWDCGLCPDHEQHSCLSLVEITDRCNLACPVCYAESGPHREGFRPLAQIEKMFDAIVANEREPDVVQISGGEPTLHPQFFEVLDAARRRPIKHLMVNTNGLRIAQDEDFARRLAGYMPDFEVYLQFDSLEREPLVALRGADLRATREKALERLDRLGVSTTLVVTLKRGLNDGEIGRIVDYASKIRCVRGVTFQPVQDAGRNEAWDAARDRLTLTEVRRKIVEQSGIFRAEDLIPVPCHPDSLCLGYALKLEGKIVPLSGMLDPKLLIDGGKNTIVFEGDESLKEQVFRAFSTGNSPAASAARLKDLLCCLPKVDAPAALGYENVFRVLIMAFLDPWSFDLRAVKKSCVHIVHPEDFRLIPFDTYNLFYRDGLERTRAEPLRRAIEAGRAALPVIS